MSLFCSLRCVKLLYPHTDKDLILKAEGNVFYFSTAHADAMCTQYLVDSGFDISKRTRILDGDEYKPKVLRYFHSNICYSKLVSPLAMVAIYGHSLANARALLKADAPVNPRTPYEIPPLLPALDKNNLELVEELVAYGAKVDLYHPKVISNMSLIVALHNWEGLNLLLKLGAEAESLFASSNSTCGHKFPSTLSHLEDALSDGEDAEDYENEPGVLRYPIPFWRSLAEARYLMTRRKVTVFSLLLRLLAFVGNVQLDPHLRNYVDTQEEMDRLLHITGKPPLLIHFS